MHSPVKFEDDRGFRQLRPCALAAAAAATAPGSCCCTRVANDLAIRQRKVTHLVSAVQAIARIGERGADIGQRSLAVQAHV